MNSSYEYSRHERFLRRRRRRRIKRIVTAAVSIVIVLLIAAIVIGIAVAFINRHNRQDTVPEQNGNEISEERGQTSDVPSSETGVPGETQESAATVSNEPEPEPENEPVTEKIVLQAEDIHIGGLILVNRHHFYEHIGEDKMIDVFTYKSSAYKFRDTDMYLRPEAAERLNAMLVDFYKETNNGTVNIISTYRDLATQQRIYDSKLDYYGSAEKAEKWVALPGASEHHTGLAVDLGIYTDDGESYDYNGEGEFAWINRNCWKYGFIVRYSSEKTDITGIAYEPWHFRYLGLPHAEIISGTDFCYEEYMGYLKAYPYEGDHLFFESESCGKYEIFYLRSQGDTTEFELPKGSDYSVSGNNIDGFIVTVRLNGDS